MPPKSDFPQCPPPINARSIRVHVELTPVDTNDPSAKDANIISYRELLRKHIAAQQPPNPDDTNSNNDINEGSSSSSPSHNGLAGGGGLIQSNGIGYHSADNGADGSDRDDSSSDDDDQPNGIANGDGSSHTANGVDGQDGAKKKRNRLNWDDYDLDDAFIDDSDLFGAEVSYAPPAKWDYGFFVWKGPVEIFFDEYGVNEDAQSADESPLSKRKGKSRVGRLPKGVKASPSKGNVTMTVNGGDGNVGNATSSTIAGEPLAKKRKETDAAEKPKKKRKATAGPPTSGPGTPDSKNGAGLDVTTAIGALIQSLMRESASAKQSSSHAPAATTPHGGRSNNMPPPVSMPPPSSQVQVTASSQPSSQLPSGVYSPPRPPLTTADLQQSRSSPEPIPIADASTHPSKSNSTSGIDEPAVSEKKRKLSPQPIDPELELVLQILREATAKESFVEKKHFPPALRPILHEAARVSLRSGENYDNFIAHITNILPYNTFTMKKLVGKMILPEKIALKEQQVDQLYTELMRLIDVAMVSHLAEYEAACAKLRQTAPGESIDLEANGLPEKKFKMTATIRELMSHIVSTEIVLADARNDLKYYLGEETFEGDKLEKTTRRETHARLLRCWPEGWIQGRHITSGLQAQRKKNERHEQKAAGVSLATRSTATAEGGVNNNAVSGATSSSAATITPAQPPRKKLTAPATSTSAVPNNNHSISNASAVEFILNSSVVPSPSTSSQVAAHDDDDGDSDIMIH